MPTSSRRQPLTQLCHPAINFVALHVPPLLGSVAQNSFESGVEIPADLGHALIAILAKKRRWLVVFKDSPALIVLEQNHAQWGVESGGGVVEGDGLGGEGGARHPMWEVAV